MAQIEILKDRLTNKTVYPVTTPKAVIDENGIDLDTRLEQQRQGLENTLKEYAEKPEVDKALSGKQDALSTTTDLHITDDNILGLTESAKQRLFDDLWRKAVGSFGDIDHTYMENGVNKPYYLNTLWLTYDEAVATYTPWSSAAKLNSMYFDNKTIRTHLYSKTFDGDDFRNMFYSCAKIEVIRLVGPPDFNYDIPSGSVRGNMASTFRRCINLKYIYGAINNPSFDSLTFESCYKLEEVRLWIVGSSTAIHLEWSPKLSYDSFNWLVKRKTYKGSVAIYVHPDVYAKLTGDITNAAAAALSEEELAQWQQLLTDAAEKQITFATT